MEPTLSQALHLLNGDTVNGKIRQGRVVTRMLEAKKSTDEITTELYSRSLGREPTAEELKKIQAIVATNPNKEQALEDVFWALLNSREFLFNH